MHQLIILEIKTCRGALENFTLFYLFLRGGVILQGERVQGIFGKNNKNDKSSVKRIIFHALKG